jgi:hypothetical protein
VRLLLTHGANAEWEDEYGQTPVIRFTQQRQWEAAQLPVEHGVRLEVAPDKGVSLDHYLTEWKESVLGEHPVGWDRLREAIATRRREGGAVQRRGE